MYEKSNGMSRFSRFYTPLAYRFTRLLHLFGVRLDISHTRKQKNEKYATLGKRVALLAREGKLDCSLFQAELNAVSRMEQQEEAHLSRQQKLRTLFDTDHAAEHRRNV